MPQARMVSLGVRAALAKQNLEKKVNLPVHPAVRAVREIAISRAASKRAIHNFIDTRLRTRAGLLTVAEIRPDRQPARFIACSRHKHRNGVQGCLPPSSLLRIANDQ